MHPQGQLNGGVAGINEAVVYYRSVQSSTQLVEPESQVIDTSTDLSDIGELLGSIKKKLDYPLPLSESRMAEMAMDRVSSIFESDDIQLLAKDLLGLFCDSLEGKQRAENKYAMLIYFGDMFLLAHVRSERGMSIHDEGEVQLIRRFLDIDNILSAALFESEGDIEFSHFTDTGSDSFRNFLGVNEYRLNYRRKTIQILCYYHGRREYECKFEFTTDEFNDRWLRDENIQLSSNKLRFVDDPSQDSPHEIKEIRWANTSYTSVESFKREFKEQTLSLDIDQKKYQNLLRYPDDSGTQTSVFDAEKVIDHRWKVELKMNSGRREFVQKAQTPDNLHAIYAGPNIKLSTDFADKIYHDLMNKSDVRIYHASGSPEPQSLEVNNISFLNVSFEKVPKDLNTFLTETHNHAVTRSGETLKKCLTTAMLSALKGVTGNEFKRALSQLQEIYTGHPADGDIVSTKENEGPNLVEYKNRAHLENGDAANQIVSEIKTEIGKNHTQKVFIWGFTEQNRRAEALSTQSWKDDRITNLEKSVTNKLDSEGISYEDFLLQPVPLSNSGDRRALIGTFF